MSTHKREKMRVSDWLEPSMQSSVICSQFILGENSDTVNKQAGNAISAIVSCDDNPTLCQFFPTKIIGHHKRQLGHEQVDKKPKWFAPRKRQCMGFFATFFAASLKKEAQVFRLQYWLCGSLKPPLAEYIVDQETPILTVALHSRPGTFLQNWLSLGEQKSVDSIPVRQTLDQI